MMTPISRRLFLANAAAVAVAACSGDGNDRADIDQAASTTDRSTTTTAVATTTTTSTTTSTTLPPIELPGDPFTLGVASGDPDNESVVLWTRLAPSPLDGGGMPTDDVRVQWEASAALDFTSLIATGSEVAIAAHGHSVHAIALLPPGTWFYRFRVGEYVSPIGITRPAPAGNVAEVRFASASCQHYESGHYAAHRDIAEQSPDFLVWLGDYIYEGAGATDADPAERTHLGAEPKSVDDYRNRYARYKSDPKLQAAHAACPWFVIWDDHEVENNYAALAPQAAAETAAFGARRFAAYRAWWEHQPVRLPPPAAQDDEYRIYRQATWGDLLTLALLDGRQYRSDQACGDAVLSLDPACPESADPDRTMLGDAQEQWLLDTLAASTAQWNVIGNQVVLSDATLGDAVLNYDQWDGYPVARQRLLEGLDAAAVANLVVVTGDVHLAAVGYLRSRDEIVGVEFVTTSISSAANISAEFTDVLKDFPDLVDAELAHRGYTLHTVTPTQWTADYRIVTDVSSPESEVTTYRKFAIASGSNTVATVA
jgi:alkaline phosphatase D